MAIIKVKNLKKIQLQIRKKITQALRTKEMRSGVGNVVVEEIRKGDFGAPSEGYRQWREENDGLNTTHPKYERNKINKTGF